MSDSSSPAPQVNVEAEPVSPKTGTASPQVAAVGLQLVPKASSKSPAKVRENIPPADRPVRERKTVQQFFLHIDATPKEVKVLEIKVGKGTALSEMPNVVKGIEALKAVDPILQKLHRLIYPGHHPNKLTTKSNLRQFSGLTETTKDAIIAKANGLEAKEIRNFIHLLDVRNASGTKEKMIASLADWLDCPEVSAGEYKGKAGAKRKRSTATKKVSKKAAGSKKDKKTKTEKKSKSDKKSQDGGDGEDKEGAHADGDDDDDDDDDASESASETGDDEKDSDAAGGNIVVDDDDGDDDLPLMRQKLKAAIRKILSKGNLEELSIKVIREMLSAEFAATIVEEHKGFIKDCVHALM